ncbi:MAG: DUF424 family protein [Nanoarchaeota archaeon]|nr:DUF424 family protein [Nanoarchaeota archaeon]MBU1004235.1 DUF424 family protein [Nanoarchaeota archaeon]MBU1945872.1 DUF424 family protein [Nanoarchaeota archaeon]
MIVKVHKTDDGRKVLAICDDGLLRKKFEEGNNQLDLTSSFYNGEAKNEKETIEMIKGTYMVNIVGEGSIKLALNLGIVDKKNIIKIKDIPHAQAILE